MFNKIKVLRDSLWRSARSTLGRPEGRWRAPGHLCAGSGSPVIRAYGRLGDHEHERPAAWINSSSLTMAYRVAIGIASLHQRSLRDRPDIEPGDCHFSASLHA
jgi:hypothetical protein